MIKKYNVCYFDILNYDLRNLKILQSNYNFYSFNNPNKVDSDIKKNIDILFAPLGYSFNSNSLEKFDNLKVICSNTTGHPHIDLVYAKKRNIKVICLKFYQDFLKTITPTAEFSFIMGLALYRNIIKANSSLRKDFIWDRKLYPSPSMINKLNIGIIGLGRIGTMLSNYFNFFNSNVYFYDPYVNYASKNIKLSNLNDLVSKSDILYLCVPHEKETENLISSDVIKNFKKGIFFVNTARAELVDWTSLIESLQNNNIAGIASDVFPNEFSENFHDTFANHPLYKEFLINDNIVLTPHIAGSTEDAWFLTQKKVIDELNLYLNI